MRFKVRNPSDEWSWRVLLVLILLCCSVVIVFWPGVTVCVHAYVTALAVSWQALEQDHMFSPV